MSNGVFAATKYVDSIEVIQIRRRMANYDLLPFTVDYSSLKCGEEVSQSISLAPDDILNH